MSMPANMEVISKATVSDPKTNEELTTVIVVVHPEEGRQYTGLDVKWLIEKTERCKSEEDIPQWRSKLAGILHNSAVIIFQRFSKSKNPRDLDIVITLHRKIVALTPTAHPDYPTRMSDLALFIEDRHKLLGKAVDLDHVVDLLRTVLFERMGPHFPNLDKWYYGYLADILTMRYNIDKTEEDVEEVIALRRKVVDLTPPTPVADYVKALQLLAQALAESYRMYKTEKNMDEAIEFQRTILSSASSNFDGTEHRTFLRDHAEFMFARFGTISQHKDDVEEMIGIYEELAEKEQEKNLQHTQGRFVAISLRYFMNIQALELEGADHPLRYNTLVLLGYMLRSQFVFTGRKESLDRAINCLREALKLVPFPHEDRPMVLNNLSIILRRAFEEYDQYHFLREAIELEEEALKLPPTTLENRTASFSNIGAALWARYHRTAGSVDELDAIISFYEKALDLMTDKHPSYPFICGNLGTIMGIRLEKQDDLSVDDLRKSIKFVRISLAAFDEQHQENCTMSGNLGVACFRMYNLNRDSSHLKEGVTSFRNAANHPSAPASQKFRAAKVWAAQAEEVGDASALEAYTTVIQLLPVLVAVNADLETRQQRLKSSIAHTDGMGVAAAAYALKVSRVEDAIQFLEEGRALFWNQALKLRTPLSELKLVHQDLAERFRTISKRLEVNSFKNGTYDPPGPVSKSNDIPTMLTKFQTSVDLERLKSDWDSVLREIRQQSGFKTFLEPSHSTQLVLQKLENTLYGPVIMLCITGRISGAIIMTGNKHSYLELCDIDLGQVLNLNSEELSDSEYGSLELVYEQNPELQTILEVDGFRKKPFLRQRPATASILQYVLKELWTKIGRPIIQFLQLNVSQSIL
ncbi:hypothetical protein CPB84DRAFT_1751272 [Gymnopilus junonius]|uniref:Tetratricopeptide repeat protein n=1 Tax=Gymnopilus junonius TaxID=109634 RepID=A0A9P5THA7_GYMJU|nr:hypothetical protein CPB84DRAFT_1751272 [Gymnopilus junonius]